MACVELCLGGKAPAKNRIECQDLEAGGPIESREQIERGFLLQISQPDIFQISN